MKTYDKCDRGTGWYGVYKWRFVVIRGNLVPLVATAQLCTTVDKVSRSNVATVTVVHADGGFHLAEGGWVCVGCCLLIALNV